MEEKITKKPKFDYAWVTISLCFLMIATGLGLCSGGRTLYLTAITDALSIPRSAFSVTNTLRFITTTVVNLFFGKLCYRFGTKKLICAGFVCLILFALINSFATTLLGFYIASFFLGTGLSWTGTTMASAVINRWCTKNKGTITGAVLSANAIGAAISVQILSPIIFQEGNPFGYRTSYHLVSIVLAVVLVLIVLFYRETPKGENEKTVVSTKKRKARGDGWIGIDYATAIKKPYFYASLACIFLTGMSLQGIVDTSYPHMYDIGLDVALVATISSISNLMLTVAKFSSGILYDKTGIRISMNICFFSAIASIIGLFFITTSPFGQAIAVVRGFFVAFALPLETVMLPLFAMELFGKKDYEKFVGILVSASSAGCALGSPFGNFCYDIFGDYKIAFCLFSIIFLFVTIAMQFAVSAAKRDRKLIESLSDAEITA